MRPLAIAAIAAVAAASVHAQMYKCVDGDGRTQYTDKPVPECKGKVEIQPAPPLSGKAAPRKENLREEERAFQRRQLDQARNEKAEAHKLEQQKRACARMHAEYQRLAGGRRLARINEKGERIFVEDAEREARAAQLKGEIAQKCPS